MSSIGADYNAFGYDPQGHVASLAAYFYGPAWVPEDYSHLPSFANILIQPPRYGAPAPQQLHTLPLDFVMCLPPCYFGPPNPPYLPGPNTFSRDNFAAILRHREGDPTPDASIATQYRHPILEGLPVSEVRDGGMC